MNVKSGFLKTVPLKARIIFLAGIFFLFSTIGFVGDMTEMGRQPTIRSVLTTLLIAVFAMGYASAGTALRGESWKVMVPLCIVQFFLMNRFHAWFPSAPQLQALNTEQVAALANRLSWDGIGVTLAMVLGYTCFVYASITEGRRLLSCSC